MTAVAVILAVLLPLAAVAGYRWGVQRERQRLRDRDIELALQPQRKEEPRSTDQTYITPIRYIR